MKHHKFGKSSERRLADDVHPDLVSVARRALKYSKYDFGIGETKRSEAKQREYIANGDSWSMDSKHFFQKDGKVHAMDIVVYVDGKVSWDEGHFRKVIQAFVRAAVELNVQLEFGGLWESVFDGPHIELSDEYY
jgi:peptidoglycan L-alanyl-D-glutamate endopeptidase CwlK